ncbi:MAG: hypothetical protein KDD64_15070 [Bdellovibrionales bacterium]|nr:hypothetical protein [Bdellovibrionales bacterium]
MFQLIRRIGRKGVLFSLAAVTCVTASLTMVGMGSSTAELNLQADRIVSTAPQNELSQEQLASCLTTLKGWSEFSSFESYFVMLGTKGTLRDKIAHLHAEASGGKVIRYSPFTLPNDQQGLAPEILVTIPKALDDHGNPLPEDFGSGFKDNVDQLCVIMNGNGAKLPLPAAEVHGSAFISGLAARLAIGAQIREWESYGLEHGIDSLSLSISPNDEQTQLLKRFITKSSYPDNDFKATMPKLLRQVNLHADGLLWGWQAGDKLEKLVGTDDEAIYTAAMMLLADRFETDELGRVVGYTLNYLLGCSRVATVRAEFLAQKGVSDDPSSRTAALSEFRMDVANDILTKLTKDQRVTEAKTFIGGYHSMLLAQFSALAQNTTMPEIERGIILDELHRFLDGFQVGSMESAETQFREVFLLGYQLGYEAGFRDGFAQGYQAGYQDGYTAGYDKAWSEANVIIRKLEKQVRSLERANARLSTDLSKLRKAYSNAKAENRKLSQANRVLTDRVKSQRGGDKWLEGLKSASSVAGTAIHILTNPSGVIQNVGKSLVKSAIKKLKFW